MAGENDGENDGAFLERRARIRALWWDLLERYGAREAWPAEVEDGWMEAVRAYLDYRDSVIGSGPEMIFRGLPEAKENG